MEKTRETGNTSDPQEPQEIIDLRQELIDLYAGEQRWLSLSSPLNVPETRLSPGCAA